MGKEYYSYYSIWSNRRKRITPPGHRTKTIIFPSFSCYRPFLFPQKLLLAELMKVCGTLTFVFMNDSQIEKIHLTLYIVEAILIVSCPIVWKVRDNGREIYLTIF